MGYYEQRATLAKEFRGLLAQHGGNTDLVTPEAWKKFKHRLLLMHGISSTGMMASYLKELGTQEAEDGGLEDVT